MKEIVNKIKDRIIDGNASLLDALKVMDGIGKKILFVFEEDSFVGILTIGDIQRAIIKKNDTAVSVSKILDRNKIMATEGESLEVIKDRMMELRAECMPVVNAGGELVNVYFWSDLFIKDDLQQKREPIDLPVVIMAGGQGTRLRPLTNIMPKPLIPIGEKTILEEILDRFESVGCHKFYMSVNYKADMIAYYLNSLEHDYNIELFSEPKPLGTIGSVSMLKDKIKSPFFVSNCDIVIDQDFRDVYDYHRNNGNDITIVTAVKSMSIPYGVIYTGDNGLLTDIVEKPQKSYMINTGVYILEPEMINEIPEGEFYHITDLIMAVKNRGGKVGCFPVSEMSWKDMGDWNEYLRRIGQR